MAELFDRYGPTIFRRCRQILGNDDLAHDAAQEVFLRAIEKRSSFRGQSSPLTWLYAIATTHCLHHLRDRKRRRVKLQSLEGRADATPSPIEDRILWTRILQSFDPVVQQLAFLRHVDGFTLEEVAEISGLSRKTVAKKLERFAAGARQALAPTDAGGAA